MKTSIVLAIAALSLTAFAQTNTTTPTAPTTETTATTPAPAKKAKTKKPKKAVTNLAPAEEPTGANSMVAPSVETLGATASTPAASTVPAAGTSTASASAAAPVKKWSANLVVQAELSNDAVQRAGSAAFDTMNYVGAGYKISETGKVGIRQYFGYRRDPNASNKVVTEPLALTYGTKWGGIAGSEAIAPLFWYYVPTEALTRGLKTDAAISHNGILRLDAEILWTINPKVSVSYYLNPRQTLVSKQQFVNRAGETKFTEADTRLIHQGFAYYNISDATQAYVTGGFDHRARTATATSHSDTANLSIGAVFTMGKFMLNPEIGNSVSLKANGETVSAPRWLQSDDISYVLTGAISL